MRRVPLVRKPEPALPKNPFELAIAEAVRQKRGVYVYGGTEFRKELGAGDVRTMVYLAKAKRVSPEQLKQQILNCVHIEDVLKWLQA